MTVVYGMQMFVSDIYQSKNTWAGYLYPLKNRSYVSLVLVAEGMELPQKR